MYGLDRTPRDRRLKIDQIINAISLSFVGFQTIWGVFTVINILLRR